jgi:hypothetical protein
LVRASKSLLALIEARIVEPVIVGPIGARRGVFRLAAAAFGHAAVLWVDGAPDRVGGRRGM